MITVLKTNTTETKTGQETAAATSMLRTEPSGAQTTMIKSNLSVPIDAIFKVEFNALETGAEHQTKIRKAYEHYVSGMMNAVSVWLSLGNASKADPKKLAEAVRSADERELLSFLSEVFHKDFNASFEDRRLLSTSIEDNVFNCYSSTALFTDMLARMGKLVAIIITSNHMLLAGKEYAFETTAPSSLAVFPKRRLDLEYPIRQETDARELLAAAYDWSGKIFEEGGKLEDALAACDSALEINPKDAEVWSNKESVLYEMGMHDDAQECFKRDRELRVT